MPAPAHRPRHPAPAQRQHPDADRQRHHRRDDARQEGRLEARLQGQGAVQGGGRDPRLPAPARRPDDDRRDRQQADHRGRRRGQDRQGDPPRRRPARTRTATPAGPGSWPTAITSSATSSTAPSASTTTPARSSGATSSTSPAVPPRRGHDGHGTEVFNAIRKPDGNTIIAGGNNNRVFEVNPEGKVVWSVDHDELPGIELLWVTSLQLRPNGNLIFGNTHAGPEESRSSSRSPATRRWSGPSRTSRPSATTSAPRR